MVSVYVMQDSYRKLVGELYGVLVKVVKRECVWSLFYGRFGMIGGCIASGVRAVKWGRR